MGSGIFKSENPVAMAGAIVEAVHHYDDAKLLAKAFKGLGAAMKGLDQPLFPKLNLCRIGAGKWQGLEF